MSSLKSKLAAASPRWADIDVCLNGALSMKRDELHQALAGAVQRASAPSAADDRLAQPTGKAAARDERLGQPSELDEIFAEITAVEEEMRSQIITLRFTTLPSDEWEMLKVNAGPPRPRVAEDDIRGYNVGALVTAAAAASGQYVEQDGDEEQAAAISEEEWALLWKKLSAGDRDRVKYAILNLNETNGHAGVEYLKKGFSPTRSSGTTSA